MTLRHRARRPPARHPLPVLAALAAVCALALTACGSDSSSSGGGASVTVKAGDDSCDVSDTSLDAGKTDIQVQNVGSDVTEVYVYGKEGGGFTKIMGEKENIGPGTSQSFSVDLAAGDYQVACKPGMTGDGIRTDVKVTGEGGSSEGVDDGDEE